MLPLDVKTIKPTTSFKYKAQLKRKPRFRMRGLMFFILIIFILILFTYVLPSVTVIVVPETENISREFEIQLTTDESKVDLEKNIFASEVVETNEEGEKKFKATGQKDIGDKAQGEAVFYNHTGRSQPLTTNIDLINDVGLIFLIKQDITIPAAKVDEEGKVVPAEITVEIEAKEAGEKGNVEPGRINISILELERQNKIYGEIKTGLSGGTSKIVTVVSQDDLDNAKEELAQELKPKVKEKLKKKASNKMTVFDELISYDSSDFSKQVAVDEEAENFEMTLNLKARALIYQVKDLNSFLKEQILKDLPVGQTLAEDEPSNLEIKVEKFDLELGLADLKIKATFTVAEKINLEEIKKNILGKKEPEARRYILSLPYIKDVRFIFSLSLTDRIPKFENKVRVKLDKAR